MEDRGSEDVRSSKESRHTIRLPGTREICLIALFFLVASFAIYGWYAMHGGFVADDWVNADHYYFHPSPGFWGAVDNYQTPSRPVAAVYVSLTYAVLGTHLHLHLILSVILAAFLSVAFYALLRTLGVGIWSSLALAALLLVFPSSDSTRLWTTGSQIDLFIGLYLVGVTVAIVAKRRFGPAPGVKAVAAQAVASLLVVIAVAGYEIVAPAILLSFLWYRRVGRGGVVWRWLMDAVPTVLILIFYTRKFSGGGAHGTQLITNVGTIAEGAVSIFGYTLIPVRDVSEWLVIGGAAAIVIVALLVWRLSPRSPDRQAIGSRLLLIPAALAAVVVGYAMLVPAAERYPLYAPGVQNRTNCLAALGLCLIVFLLAATIGALIAAVVPGLTQRSRTDLRRALTAVALLGVLAIWTLRIGEDANRWQKAAEVQAQVLATAHSLVPDPPAETTIFTSPYAGYSAPSIPIFGGGGNNDEVGAFKVTYDSDDMRAYPFLEGAVPECKAKSIWTPDAGESVTAYGHALMVDARANRVYRPLTKAQCLRETKAMEPFGPVNLTEGW